MFFKKNNNPSIWVGYFMKMFSQFFNELID